GRGHEFLQRYLAVLVGVGAFEDGAGQEGRVRPRPRGALEKPAPFRPRQQPAEARRPRLVVEVLLLAGTGLEQLLRSGKKLGLRDLAVLVGFGGLEDVLDERARPSGPRRRAEE